MSATPSNTLIVMPDGDLRNTVIGQISDVFNGMSFTLMRNLKEANAYLAENPDHLNRKHCWAVVSAFEKMGKAYPDGFLTEGADFALQLRTEHHIPVLGIASRGLIASRFGDAGCLFHTSEDVQTKEESHCGNIMLAHGRFMYEQWPPAKAKAQALV